VAELADMLCSELGGVSDVLDIPSFRWGAHEMITLKLISKTNLICYTLSLKYFLGTFSMIIETDGSMTETYPLVTVA